MSSPSRPLITVFTPVFNRADLLGNLLESLIGQTQHDFEWLVIDDGSTDETSELLEAWSALDLPFDFNHHRVPNGGKPRAINRACTLAQGEFLFIVDSDDIVVKNGIEKISRWIEVGRHDPQFVGVGGVHEFSHPGWKAPRFLNNADGYVRCTNRDREAHGIFGEMNEAYRIEVLSRFRFQVWPGEKFAPEQITLDEIGMAGWNLHWRDEVICVGDYQPDGLTAKAGMLEVRNPMGYAMLANHKLKYARGRALIRAACQHIALAIVGKNPAYIARSNRPLLTLVSLPFGLALSVRRRRQFRSRLSQGASAQ